MKHNIVYNILDQPGCLDCGADEWGISFECPGKTLGTHTYKDSRQALCSVCGLHT